MRWLFRYDRLEQVFSAVLLIGMIGVTALATLNCLRALWPDLHSVGAGMDYAQFQSLFDRALAAIIALELSRSVYQGALGRHGLVQVRTVVNIGVLAVVRKFVLVDIETVSGILLIGLAAAVLALGTVYALTHWIEETFDGRRKEE